MENVSKSSFTNIFSGGINQINQENILSDNSSISQNVNRLDTLMSQLRKEVEKISNPTLKEKARKKIDMLERLRNNPRPSILKKIGKFFRENLGEIASVGGLVTEIIKLLSH